MPRSFDPARIERRDWQWGHSATRYEGASLQRGKLVWYTTTRGGLGDASSSQSYRDFLERGPCCADVPADIVAEIRGVLEAAQLPRQPRGEP